MREIGGETLIQRATIRSYPAESMNIYLHRISIEYLAQKQFKQLPNTRDLPYLSLVAGVI
jgi:hypothetical protein